MTANDPEAVVLRAAAYWPPLGSSASCSQNRRLFDLPSTMAYGHDKHSF